MIPTGEPFKILFICTGNSARSIFGEYLIEGIGKGLFESYSAGANPIGRVNPYAQRVLKEVYHIDASKAWSKGFEHVEAEKFDFVITVCDKARETCLVWPASRSLHIGALLIQHLLKEQTKKFISNSSKSRLRDSPREPVMIRNADGSTFVSRKATILGSCRSDPFLRGWYEIVRAISFNTGRISLYAGSHNRRCGFRHKVKSAHLWNQ
jgi:protein-tyrosine-phosphatase